MRIVLGNSIAAAAKVAREDGRVIEKGAGIFKWHARCRGEIIRPTNCGTENGIVPAIVTAIETAIETVIDTARNAFAA